MSDQREEFQRRYEAFYYEEQIKAYLAKANANTSAVASADVASPSSVVASVDVALPSASGSASASVSGFLVLSPFAAAAAAPVGPGVVPTSGSNVAGGSGALEQSVSPPAFTGFALPSASPSSESSSAGGGQVARVRQQPGRTWRLLNRPELPSSAPPPSAAVRDFWLDSSLADSSLNKYKVQWEEWCA
jgi:hypothetical protein